MPTAHGSLYFHVDYREVHYCKILLDGIFGRENFQNEIIRAYDYGGRPRRRQPAKHDNILFYVKDIEGYVFHQEAIERIPYMEPGLVGPEKAARRKLPTDTWWHTIVPTNGAERRATRPGSRWAFCGGSFRRHRCPARWCCISLPAGALELGRRFLLVDNNPEALAVMAQRFGGVEGIMWAGFDPTPYQKDRTTASPVLGSGTNGGTQTARANGHSPQGLPGQVSTGIVGDHRLGRKRGGGSMKTFTAYKGPGERKLERRSRRRVATVRPLLPQ